MSARSMMPALGWIQALCCNSNRCPVGVATQDPGLAVGLHVKSKAERIRRYHHDTVHSFTEILGAAGLVSPDELEPWHLQKWVNGTETKSHEEIDDLIEGGALLHEPVPGSFELAWYESRSDRFARVR